MAISAQRVSVTSTAVALNTASTWGMDLLIKNATGAVTDLGPAGVTSGQGFELAAGATVEICLEPGDVLFAVTATSSTLHVLRT